LYTLYNSMRKNIDIDSKILTKLKVLSVIEQLSVKGLMEKAVELYVKQKENIQFEALNEEQKLDMGLLLLMKEAQKGDLVSRDEVFAALD
jgi:hypothetical protein